MSKNDAIKLARDIALRKKERIYKDADRLISNEADFDEDSIPEELQLFVDMYNLCGTLDNEIAKLKEENTKLKREVIRLLEEMDTY